MKVKRLLIALLLLICCTFAFSACSNGTQFNFDENGTVNLTYTCTDEEKNFNAELNAEQSRKFILSLNKISYSETNDRDINLAPSYDSLIIKVNNETLSLFDVAYIIKYGGYFHLNGNLCKSEEKFSFLQPYLVEYCPDIIPSSIPYGVQYVKQTVGGKDNYKIIKSVGQLNDYIANETQNFFLPDYKLFKDEVIDKYNDGYFENSFIVIFMKALSSGSFDFKINDVSINGDRLIIDYKIILPEGNGEYVDVTCDMAYWYSFVELSNEYGTISDVDLIPVK